MMNVPTHTGTEQVAGTKAHAPRHKWPFAVKIAITAVLCMAIAVSVDWSAVSATFRNASIAIILLILVMRFLGVPLSAWKWQQLLAVHDVRYRLLPLQRWYFSGMFLSYLLPTSIGGDAYRIYKTLGNDRGRSCAVMAVFAERLSGMLALLLMGLVAACILAAGGDTELAWPYIGGAIGAAILLVITLLGGRPAAAILRRLGSWRLPGKVQALLERGAELGEKRGRLIVVALLSFAFHALRVGVFWLAIRAFGVSMDPLALVVVMALTEIIGMLPLSLGGLGLIDGAFIVLAHRYGLTPEIGISTMILLRLLLIPMLAVGCGCYLFEGSKRHQDPGSLKPAFAEHKPAERSL